MESSGRPINYWYISLWITGEKGYDNEELPNLKDIYEQLPRRQNNLENYHSYLTTVLPGEEEEEVRVVLKLYNLEHEGI